MKISSFMRHALVYNSNPNFAAVDNVARLRQNQFTLPDLFALPCGPSR
jgi:hypothetical protein